MGGTGSAKSNEEAKEQSMGRICRAFTSAVLKG
jgi:hypothetical protein